MTYTVQMATPRGQFIMKTHEVHKPMDVVKGDPNDEDREIDLVLNIAEHLPAGALAIDAGANVGLVSVPLARVLSKQEGVVLAYEARRLIYYMLAGNTALSGLENLVCKQLALFEPQARVNDTAVTPLFGEEERRKHAPRPTAPIDAIQSTTIDREGLERLDFLKIDNEDAEIAILNGAAATIERFQPIIWITMWPDQYGAVHGWLSARGYSMAIVGSRAFCAVPQHARDGFPDLGKDLGLQPFNGEFNPLAMRAGFMSAPALKGVIGG